MLLTPRALKFLKSIENPKPRIMSVVFNGNPGTMMVSGYSSTNTSDETDITTFSDGLSSLARIIIKQHVLIIGENMNVQIS